MEFKSAITRGGNAVLPEIINVTEFDVTWKKRNKSLISSDSISIPVNSITSVEIDTSLIGTIIKIKSQGQSEIVASNFTATDAKEIKRLINQYKSEKESEKESEKKAKQVKKVINVPINRELELKKFEEEKYVDVDRIALITFPTEANGIIQELNKLSSLLKISIEEKENKKVVLYQNKIKQGIELLALTETSPQQKQLLESVKQDLHNIIIQNNLFEGLRISKDNPEKIRTVFNFLLRQKWWALLILSLIYVSIRNYFG